jgi:hypothetical protein
MAAPTKRFLPEVLNAEDAEKEFVIPMKRAV